MAAYAYQSSSNRTTVLVAIIAAHVLMGWALVSGLARSVVESIAAPLITDLIDDIQVDEPPPPPPPPVMERPPVEVPPPVVSIDIPVQTTTTAISDVTDKPRPPAPPPPPPAPVAKPTPAKLGRNFPNSEEYYPSASKRAEEQGSPTVQVCVGANGRLTRDPVVTASSGFPRLDEGAVKLAKSGRYEAGTLNGAKAAESCIQFKVRFEIK